MRANALVLAAFALGLAANGAVQAQERTLRVGMTADIPRAPGRPDQPSALGPGLAVGPGAVGLGAAGLPFAVQSVGRSFDEACLLRAGRAVERDGGWAA